MSEGLQRQKLKKRIIESSKKIIKHQVLYVEWIDPTSCEDWDDLNEVKEFNPYIVRSCGFLIREDEAFMTLALSFIEENNQCSNYLVIPKTHIKATKVVSRGL